MWKSTVHVIVHKIRTNGIEVVVEITSTVKMSLSPKRETRKRNQQ